MKRASLLAVVVCAAFAQPAKFEFWPGSTYDAAVPTPKKVLGYDFGDRISSHANIVKYLQALASAQPNRIKLFEYGKTWEGRELVYAVIGSEANMRRLPEIRSAMQRLHDPRKTSQAEAQKLMAGLPAIIWLAYGVHGNEISSPDAGLVTAYHLLASRGNKMVDGILANTLAIVCPLQNPDGRNRFIHDFEINEGLEPDPNPLAAEHTEGWAGGRTNHYYFDLNRDWLGITQPETAGHIKALQEWYPEVFIDLHEMGTDATYYFTPEADPYNPYLTKEQHDDLYWFGKNNAKYFDQFGFSYFTRENYDAFYPGYGASWPFYFGGLAMTYENGSTRGLVVRKSDESVVTYRDTVRRHFVTSISSCEAAAENREKLIEMYYRYQVNALDEASKDPVKEYILPRKGDTAAVDKMAQLLAFQGVEVNRATAAFSSGGKQYPAGSYVVPLTQPERRLVRDVLDPQVSMDEAFLKGEEHRRQRRLRSEIYDVTAWSLPLQFNVECVASDAKSSGNFEVVKAGETPFRSPVGKVQGKATVAYLVPWGTTAAARMLTASLREGLRVRSTDKKFTLAGRMYPDGTLIVMVKENEAGVHAAVQKLAASSGAEVVATDSGWVDEGPNFGSARVMYMKRPSILLAWDRPANATSAGTIRFVLERQFGYPVTVIRTQQIGGADLSKFHVIILPEGGGYPEVLGANGVRRLHDWVQAGGTLIGVGSALSFMASNGMLAVSQENAPGSNAGGAAGGGRGGRGGGAAAATPAAAPAEAAGGRVPGKVYATEAEFEKDIQPETQAPWPAHGFIAKAKVDQEHWITAGVPESVNALVSGSAIYTPIKADRGINAVVYAQADQVMASGYTWEEFRKQLAFKPFLIVQRDGRGNEIGFTADPNYRAYMDGLNLLFINAVFRGPAHTGGGGGPTGENY